MRFWLGLRVAGEVGERCDRGELHNWSLARSRTRVKNYLRDIEVGCRVLALLVQVCEREPRFADQVRSLEHAD